MHFRRRGYVFYDVGQFDQQTNVVHCYNTLHFLAVFATKDDSSIIKVQIFWEVHKNLKKSPTLFYLHYLTAPRGARGVKKLEGPKVPHLGTFLL